jgi:hypothetical protein
MAELVVEACHIVNGDGENAVGGWLVKQL